MNLRRTLMMIGLLGLAGVAAAEERASTSGAHVGESLVVQGVSIPGMPVVPKPLKEDRPNVVLRIAEVYPRVAGGVYDFECYGLEPGQHDLRDFLQYEDGSALDSVEPILISVESLLPQGHILPQTLENDRPPRLGGYRVLVALFSLLWIAGLLSILFVRRRKPDAAAAKRRPATLAELLAPKLAAARCGELPPDDFAELERMIIEHWRRQTGQEAGSFESARHELMRHPQAGPLLTELEAWMHRPHEHRESTLEQLVARHDEALQATPCGGPA